MKSHRGLVLVALAAAAFAIVQIWIGIWRYDIFRAGVDDGIFTQAVLALGTCFCAAAEGRQSHLLVHFSPILTIAYPFARLFGDARGLAVLQALAISTTAFPVYAIARRYVNDLGAAAIAAVSMLYPVLWAQTFTDFHENAFVPALSATLAWALLARRWRWCAAAAALLLLVKEDQSVLLALNGISIAFFGRRDRELLRFGTILAVAAVTCGVLYFEVVRPLMHPPGPYYSLSFFDWSAASWVKPGAVPPTSPIRFEYVFWAFLPLLFLPFGSRLFVLAIPPLLEVLASHFATLLVFQAHYSMLWSGYVLAAFADTAARLCAKRRVVSVVLPLATAAAALCVLQYRDPMARWYYLYRKPDAGDAQLNGVLASLPAAANVSGSDAIYAHLASRANGSDGVTGDYYVADTTVGDPTWDSRDKQALAAAVRAKTWTIVSNSGGIIVAKRVR